jgi:hypothetical protein
VKVSGERTQTAAEIRAQANQWYARQIEVCSLSMGTSWPAFEAWVTDYLKAELRERLIARGWRPRDGQ